jgi:hypothetical protein
MSVLLQELDRLEGLERARSERRLAAIGEMRAMAGEFGVENAIARLTVGGESAAVRRGRVMGDGVGKGDSQKVAKGAKGEKSPSPRPSPRGEGEGRKTATKSSLAAREWLDGLAPGTEFSIGEMALKVSVKTGEKEEAVKMRLYAWLGYLRERGQIEKGEGKGRWKKPAIGWGVEHPAPPADKKGGAWAMREQIAAELAAKRSGSEE